MSCHSSREWRQKHLQHQGAIIQKRNQEELSSILYPSYSESHPWRFHYDRVTGSPDDSWLLLAYTWNVFNPVTFRTAEVFPQFLLKIKIKIFFLEKIGLYKTKNFQQAKGKVIRKKKDKSSAIKSLCSCWSLRFYMPLYTSKYSKLFKILIT